MVAKKKPTEAELNALRDCWLTYEKYGYDAHAAGEALEINEASVRRRVKKAMALLGVQKRSLGSAGGRRAEKQPLPKKGVKRILLTCLQNNTRINDKVWESLMRLKEFWNAELKISTFTYAPQSDGSVKRGTNKKSFGYKTSERWYDERAEPYISDEFEELAPGLVWCGHSNRLPTAADPLVGVDSINGRSSGIWPHTTIQMRSVATMQSDPAKFNWSTGTVGLKNYMQKFAGQRAEFHHAYGACLVEIVPDGSWWCRNLNADSEGVIYDLEIFGDHKGVWQNQEGAEAIVFGDIHRAKLDKAVSEGTFGDDRMVDRLHPKLGVYQDLLDMQARRHHSRKDPHERYRVYVNGVDSVLYEVIQAGEYLDETARPWMDQLVIRSNHDADLDRWLRETDWRDDMVNAEYYLDANRYVLESIRAGTKWNVFEWTCRYHNVGKRAKWNPEDNSVVVCKKYGGGIELGLHGDKGPNGAPGTPRNLSRLGRKIVIGDKHAPGIYDGCYVAGVTGSLHQGYNTGPSSWAHAHVVVYPNGKRQVVCFYRGCYSADDYLAYGQK